MLTRQPPQTRHKTRVGEAEEHRVEAPNILRSLVDRITLTPNDQGKLEIDLFGDLARILQLAANTRGRPDVRTASFVQQV